MIHRRCPVASQQARNNTDINQESITTDATGAISFAASASTGETDTGWVVTEGGSAGDTIVISNHG